MRELDMQELVGKIDQRPEGPKIFTHQMKSCWQYKEILRGIAIKPMKK